MLIKLAYRGEQMRKFIMREGIVAPKVLENKFDYLTASNAIDQYMGRLTYDQRVKNYRSLIPTEKVKPLGKPSDKYFRRIELDIK